MSLRTEAIAQGLTSEEYDQIVQILGREPGHVEVGIFSAMWSEHCCYKSSRIHLKNLPTKGSRVVQGPGENAGIVDIGNGYVVAFKIESHNHPSFIEPYQGAATGVGGILRDIFTMGARPIAILDSLSFGEPSNEKTPYLVHGVIGGIGGYGNCIGIPTVGGEVRFDASYNGNNLVNAMAVGIARKEHIHKAVAKGKGNIVFYLGSKTGRDGIHGATMASQEFGSGNEERRPTVQVGDPFAEKLVMEACLQMMEEGILVGIQDMGAAGIACSTFEMSGRGKSGMDVRLDEIPLREKGMNAWEIFLSESQERMLLVAEPSKVDRVMEIARKWDIDCLPVGTVTDTGRVVAHYHGEKVVDLPVHPVTDGGPLYDRPSKPPVKKNAVIKAEQLTMLNGLEEALLKLQASPNLSSREFVYRQYDHTVGTDTVILPGSDAALMRIKGLDGALGIALDSNAPYCDSDPYLGMMHVMAEAVRNLACTGARGIAVTNCLNFGSPEVPEVMGQLKESIRGLSDACRFFDTPVTGGNVSLYNQTGTVNIKPTPAIGMIGWMENVRHRMTIDFKEAGHVVALLGSPAEAALYQSEYARTILGREDLACPPIDLQREKALQETLLSLTEEGVLSSAHDCSDGGVVQTLIESCLANSLNPIGVTVSIPSGFHPTLFLFGEYASRAVISFKPELQSQIETIGQRNGIRMLVFGKTGGNQLRIEGQCNLPLTVLTERRESFFEGL